MTTFDPAALVRQFAAAVNAHDYGRLAALFDANGLVQDMGQQQVRSLTGEPGPHIPKGAWPRGREGIELYWRRWFDAVPDLRLVLYGLTAAEAGAALEFTFQGTHRGDFLGIPATGNRIGCQAAGIFSFLGGKIHELRLYYDLATLERQLGGRVVEGGGLSEAEAQAREQAAARARIEGAAR